MAPCKEESNRQTTMEDIDGGLRPAVGGQSLDEDEDDEGGPAMQHHAG